MTSFVSLLTMIAAFIVAIGILVSVHEFGHFWVARRCGIRVLRFSVGFGKPIWKRTAKDGVEYMIGSIPLGGYVKLLDEREGNVAPEDAPYSFNRASHTARILTLLAGPAANLVFAVLVYWVLFMIGVPALKPVVGEVTRGSLAEQAGMQVDDVIVSVRGKSTPTRDMVMMSLLDGVSSQTTLPMQVQGQRGQAALRSLDFNLSGERKTLTEPEHLLKGLGFDFWYAHLPATVGQLVKGGPAEQAGMQVGDQVLTMNDEPIGDFVALVEHISAQPNRQAKFTVARGTQQLTLTIQIGEQTTDGRSVGRIGIGAVKPESIQVPEDIRTLQQYAALPALLHGAGKTWETSTLSLKLMWQMVIGNISAKNLSGPISIAEYTCIAAKQGLRVFVDWLALISISIGIFNLLPLPMLDGGQVVYQVIEWLKGSPLSERVQHITQQVGIAMLMLLLSLTLYNDIARHF